MKKMMFALASAVLAASALAAVPKGWTDDFDAARKLAEKDAKPMLVLFTGSDWCIWCQRLEEQVLSQHAFSTVIPKEMVAVFLDFPNDGSVKPQRRMRNEELARKYGVRGFPTVLLMDAEGKPFARTGFRPGGPEAYVKHLRELAKKAPGAKKAEKPAAPSSCAKPGAK